MGFQDGQLIASDTVEQHRGSDRYLFTVFTATYNRAATLPRVYDSLAAQTYRNFEWLVIDDGSTDNTQALIKQWQAIAEFPIRYFYQHNSGKHVAYNFAAQTAAGELLVCLDSDDACVPHTLACFKEHWESIPESERHKFSGVDCHCMDTDGNLIGTLYPMSPIDSHHAEIQHRYGVRGEKWGFQRTEIMREFRFPEFPGLKLTHIPEDIIWVNMTKKYPARYVNEALRIYYTDDAQDHLTRKNWAVQNPVGYSLSCKNRLEAEIEYFIYNPRYFLAAAVNYTRSHLHLKTSLKQQFSDLQRKRARLLWAITLPLGYLFWLKDSLQNHPKTGVDAVELGL